MLRLTDRVKRPTTSTIVEQQSRYCLFSRDYLLFDSCLARKPAKIGNIDIATARDDAHPLSRQALSQRPKQRRRAGHPGGLNCELQVIENGSHGVAHLFIADKDDLLQQFAAY